MISNCGHDENGKYSGGKAGDQTGGEYCVRTWYSRPWKCVLRYPNTEVAEKLASIAKAAANNNNIGYDQGERTTYYYALKSAEWKPSKITKKVETDCSASTSANVIATGNRMGIKKLKTVDPCLTTYGMRVALGDAGFDVLTNEKYLTSEDYLLPGDILLKDDAHVAINLDKGSKANGKALITPASDGFNIKWLQEKLNACLNTSSKSKLENQKLKVDGSYGSQTSKAVYLYWQQLDWKTSPKSSDGTYHAGEKTINALKSLRKN